MAIGKKTGGRQAGTPNRRTAEVAARLDELGCDPIEGMAMIAMDTASPPELRGRMYAELAQYVAPKRKAVELDTGSGEQVVFQIGIPRDRCSDPSAFGNVQGGQTSDHAVEK